MDNPNPHHGLPPINSADKPKRNNTWIYLAIILLLLTTNIILFTKKGKTDKKLANTESQLEFHQVENENLQLQYSAALKKLDELTGQNAALDKIINDKNSEISQVKSRIETILSNKNATERDLKEAQSLIAKLNSRINGYEKQIATLKQENKQLRQEKEEIEEEVAEVKEENELMSSKLETAKVFSASNISIIPIDLKRKGEKEVETSRAKRVDVLRVKFDINENRISESGPQTFYIRIINPEGKLLVNQALGSGRFEAKDLDQPLQFTISKSLIINEKETVRNVLVDWEQTADYIKGSYNIELYHSGYLIGKGLTHLR